MTEAQAPPKRKVQVHLFCEFAESGLRRFLVLRRPPERGAFWQPVTGNVLEGEDIEAAARRELAEETGVLSTVSCTRVNEFKWTKQGEQIVEHVFVAEARPCKVVLSPEHVDHRWEPYETARDLMFYESNKQALDRVVAFLGGVKRP
jgi:8-oxo-dGTP pyrophosphatase MutT (NUDIX family)